jgi:hypothetical protein
MNDFTALEPFINSSFSIAMCVYLLYERSKTNDSILKTLQEISNCMVYVKDEIKDLRRN